ncbi:MAG TPA: hypothetical protein VFT34_03910 [Verrucomicrobiae bacterium]|nr:hypothetical protein [Verrucomicrobiae bacterium]
MIENGRTNKLKGYTSDLIGDISLDWLKQRDAAKPFCLMMQPTAPQVDPLRQARRVGAVRSRQ